MLDRIEFLIAEAFVSLRRNLWMTFAAVSTAAMALFLLGWLAFAYLGFSKFVADLGKRAEMKVMLLDSVTDKDAAALNEKLKGLPGVASVRYVPREAGLKALMAQNPDLDIEGLEIDNPLPNSYVVRVQDLKEFDQVAARIRSMKEVEPNGVKYAAAEQEFLTDSMRVTQWLGAVLGGLMLLTSGVLIYNAIRMTVMARRREIRIMQLVGATRFMVWTPMLLEGIVQGLIGGALASLVLWSAYTVVQNIVVRNLTAFGTMGHFPITQALLVLGLVGGLYGFVCSLVALREPIRLRRSAV